MLDAVADALADQLGDISLENGTQEPLATTVGTHEPHATTVGTQKPLAAAGKKKNKKLTALPLPALSLADGSPLAIPARPKFLYPKREWKDLPEWIVLDDERGTGKKKPFPPLSDDLLFRNNGGPVLLPFAPQEGAPTGPGAAVVCPGGNLEFLHPREGYPIASWLAETMGIPAFVVGYRLLPEHGLDEMVSDLHAAVRHARRHANGGPVVAFGFSAGGYVCAAGAAAAAAAAPTAPPTEAAPTEAAPTAASDAEGSFGGGGRPDALALMYPCTCPDGWLVDDECGFHRAECDTPQVQSLTSGKERLRAGEAFVPPPPLFVVASTADWVCPPESETDPYVDAARQAGVAVEYLKGDWGDHGFGLKRFWTTPCAKWLQALGVGVPPG